MYGCPLYYDMTAMNEKYTILKGVLRMSQGPSMEPGNYSCDASQTADMSNHVCRSVTSPPTDRCWTAQVSGSNCGHTW